MPRATLMHLSCPPNFLCASYLDERMLMYEPIVNLTATPTYLKPKENSVCLGCSIVMEQVFSFFSAFDL